jgi:hypothetical protein
MQLPAMLVDPVERRNTLVATGLITTAVAVLAFGAGPGGIFGPAASAGTGPEPPDAGGVVTAAGARPLTGSSTGAAGEGDGMDHTEDGSDPSTSAATEPPSEDGGEPVPVACPGLMEAVVSPFEVHFDKAHLERSPSEQVSDVADVDQYAKTHTVLFGQMLDPLFRLLLAAPGGLDPFFVHFDKAHLERSPSEQVSDVADVDQYAKTHTVLFEEMLAPSFGVVTGPETC